MSEFTNYADVQAALDAEYNLWVSGGNPQGRTPEGQAARDWWASYNNPAPAGGGGGGGGGGAPPPRPIDPWIRTSDYTPPQGIKQADPDLVLFQEEPIDPEFLIDRTFEQIGGTELLRISRSDLINGDNVVYTPIANLSYFRRQFNPNNIIALDSTINSGFSEFSIDLMSRGIIDPYLDDDGNLVIQVDIIKKSENIETEIASNGTMNRIEL